MERAPYFGVRFRPGQAAGFVREKIADLTDAVHSVPDFLDLRAEQMIDAGTMVERRFLIESALMKALTGVTDRLMPALVGALAMIDTRHGNIRVRKLASMCNVSERQLERLFLERVGIAPKLYMRIRRFRSVLNYFEDPPDTTRTSFAETAAAFGYVDQSHLARDFRDFAYQLSA
jgi:AraC-like DNA-binding protein